MRKQLFPREFLNSSIEHYTFKINRTSVSVYQLTGLSVLLVLILLPFVKVDITTQTKGVITTNFGNKQIHTPISAPVLFSGLLENRPVQPGDTLLRLDDRHVKDRISTLSQEFDQLILFITDLEWLLQLDSPGSAIPLKSAQYQLVHSEFQTTCLGLQHKLSIEKSQLERQQKLHQMAVISNQEFEKDQFEYRASLSQYINTVDQYKTRWKARAHEYKLRKQELLLQIETLKRDLKKYSLVSQTHGYLLNTRNLSSDEWVLQGEILGEISVDTILIANCLVNTQDIGFIQPDQTVRISIDAYDFNDWGLMDGAVFDISHDIYLVGEQPFFQVKCRLANTQLSLQNGFVANLKKGMTLHANFVLTERTLWQILFDKVDNWFNPSKRGV